MDDKYNPILDGYYAKYLSKNGRPVQSNFGWIIIISFQKSMTSTIQSNFGWIFANNILPIMDDQYNPILGESYTKKPSKNG